MGRRSHRSWSGLSKSLTLNERPYYPNAPFALLLSYPSYAADATHFSRRLIDISHGTAFSCILLYHLDSSFRCYYFHLLCPLEAVQA